MRSAWKIISGIAAAVVVSAAAPASAITITDTWNDPAGEVLLDLDDVPLPGVDTYAYLHDITDDGFNIGDTISSAILSVTVRDAGGSETYQYEIAGGAQTSFFSNVPSSRTDQITLSALSLSDLQSDGLLDVLIRITGDSNQQEGLYFVSSSLAVETTSGFPQISQVPEPATLTLIGSGILLGWRCRRRSSRRA